MTDAEAAWKDLAGRAWRRSRTAPTDAVCAVYGTAIHPKQAYYRRPAYTDGTVWLSQRAYDDLQRWITGRPGSRATRPSSD